MPASPRTSDNGTALFIRCTDGGANDGKCVELCGTSAGEVKLAATVTLDPTNLATSAKQDDGNTHLAAIDADTLQLVTLLTSLLALLPSAIGPASPAGSLSTVATQSAPVTWQVPVTTAARALLIAWVHDTVYVAGQAVINDSGKVYVARTGGAAAASGGPTGTGANITDGAARWDYVAPSATAFRGSLVLRNATGSAAPLYYSHSAALAPGGAEIPAGQGEPVLYGDATTIFVATASNTATATVVAYP